MDQDVLLPTRYDDSAETSADSLALAVLQEEGEVFKAPCLLLFDTSSSMCGSMNEINQAARDMQAALQNSPDMRNIVEVAVVQFGYGGANMVCDFTPGRDLNLPEFRSGGSTPMGEAIMIGLKALKKRTQAYKDSGKHVYKPFIFLFTDGGPNDSGWEKAREVLLENQKRKKVNFLPFATETANDRILASFHIENVIFKISQEADLSVFFKFVTDSMSALMSSRPGDSGVGLQMPSGVNVYKVNA